MEYYNVFFTDKVLIQVLASSGRSAEEFARQIKRGASVDSVKATGSDQLNYLVDYTNGTAVYVAADSERDAVYFGKYIQPGISVRSAREVFQANGDNDSEQALEYAKEKIRQLGQELYNKEAYIIAQNAVNNVNIEEQKNEIKKLNDDIAAMISEMKKELCNYDVYNELNKIGDDELKRKLYHSFNLHRLNLMETVWLSDHDSHFVKALKRTAIGFILSINDSALIVCGYDKLTPAAQILLSTEYGDLNNKKELIRQLHLSP